MFVNICEEYGNRAFLDSIKITYFIVLFLKKLKSCNYPVGQGRVGGGNVDADNII